MDAKKMEMIGLASLTVFSIAVVGFATAGRTATVDAVAQTNTLATSLLISNAHASPMAHVEKVKPELATADEQAPIYLDLGARF
jgi:hypothetical protein